jgi:hypothetical protein
MLRNVDITVGMPTNNEGDSTRRKDVNSSGNQATTGIPTTAQQGCLKRRDARH